ncbi:MAG TPA: Plug domain-containing protein, partial [Chitinophaga sp.]|uniref:Plug domain-containing protein n=1 Tax=Chitinophaga sp. TaxID=1869181 RepID=UPI002BCF893B
MKSIRPLLLLLLGTCAYTSAYSQATKDKKHDTILPPPSPKQLKAISITGTRSDIELKADKKVFNVGKDILSKGGNANDILGNVPSVNVDVQGNISLRGNENVRILINGKASMLTVNNGLRQIPASSIEKIEVITNPSSAYEA